MKTLLLLTLGILSASTISAENTIQVKPCTVESGITDNDYDEDHMLEVEFLSDNADQFTAIQFDMYLPEGMAINTECDLNPDRFEGTVRRGIFTPYANYSVTDKGDGHYLFILYDEDLTPIHGASGTAIMFYYTTTAEFTDTYAPVVFKNIVLKPADGDKVEIAENTSYVKVGNPKNATLTLTGEIPSFVNEALAEEAAISTLDLTNATASNGTFTYKEGRSVIAPTASVVAPSATYTRNIAEGKWGSICLPIELTSTDKIKYYTLASANSSSITLTEAATVEANTPAFFQILSGDVVYAEGTDVELKATPATGSSANGLTMTGTYASMNLATEAGYYISDGKLYNDGATVAPFRTYLAGSVAGVKSLSVYIDNETGLHEITDQLSQEDIYNLQGMKLQQAQKGINIIGGKKVLRK